MRVLFIFLDGVGLGQADPETNPFALTEMPVMESLLGGKRLLKTSAPLDNKRASLRALDANLGVKGLPQSATGQATLLCGVNVPGALGYHYGPKPNPETAAFIRNGNLFSQVRKLGKSAAFLNAYPPGYFQAIESGRRLYAAIPLAATSAGLRLYNKDDLYAGRAISADFTAQGWRTHLGWEDTPVLKPDTAGQRLAELASGFDFAFFEYWLSDYAGHGQEMSAAYGLLKTFDQVLQGLLATWDDDNGLIVITSDHGNMEDLSTRRHTANPAPLLLIGAQSLRDIFTRQMQTLADIAPAIINILAV